MNKICVIGASGRTGSLILSVLGEYSDLTLGAAIVSSSSKKLGAQTGTGSVAFTSNIAAGVAASDIVIDFSTPKSSLEAVAACVASKRPVLVATTGLSPQQIQQIERAAHDIPILIASNTSVGIFALGEAAELAQRLLGPTFDVEIVELHHRMKKDAPSGTALSLGRRLRDQSGAGVVHGRAALSTQRGEKEIAIESIRGGDAAGEHTIYFLGRGERIELKHSVSDRAVFARGALRLASVLATRSAGLHTVAGLLRG